VKAIALLLLAFGLPAYVPGAARAQIPVQPDPARLYEGWWRLVQITSASGKATQPEALLTARFTPNGIVGGMVGPNGWSGSYTATRSGTMRLKSFNTDLIGGLEAVRSGEYLKWMLLVRSFEVTDLRLKLPDSRVLLFQREPIGWPADRGHSAASLPPFARPTSTPPNSRRWIR
jgi:hypothetical protein